MGHGGRPSELERPASTKIMSLLPEDGSEMPLTELRKAATTKLHMSPTTLTKNLREMAQGLQVIRRVDSLNSRTYYSRNPLLFAHIPSKPGAPPVDIHEMGEWVGDWLESVTIAINSGLATTFLAIIANRNEPLEKAIVEENGRCIFNSGILKLAWSTISDFQWLVRRMDPAQLKEFIPHVVELAKRSLDAFTQRELDIMKKKFPELMQREYHDMSLEEWNKLIMDPQSRAVLHDKMHAAAKGGKMK